MLRRTPVVSLFLALLLAVIPTAQAKAPTVVPPQADYDPQPGAFFSYGGGSDSIRSIVLNAINNTPSGSVIRVVMWAFSDMGIAKAVNAADNRGVEVKMLIARSSAEYSATQYLRDYVDNTEGSFVKLISHAGRGAQAWGANAGTLHQKSWTFSTTGSAHWVTIVTSANATDEAHNHQFNDAWRFVDYLDVYNDIKAMFEWAQRDQLSAAPFRQFSHGLTQLTFSPWNGPTMADPVVRRIRDLPTNRLSIRIANAAWSGTRGVRIAHALAAKKRDGAKIWVIHGKPFGDNVRDALRDAEIPMRNRYLSKSRYLHSKFMTASYYQNGRRATRVWQGSENWGDGSRSGDELVARIVAGSAHTAYVRQFDWLWSR